MIILSTKSVKTRKDYICCGCLRKLQKGTIMETSAIADGGTVYNWRTCITCTELLNKNADYFKNYDDVFEAGCVSDSLGDIPNSETPEKLLFELNKLLIK